MKNLILAFILALPLVVSSQNMNQKAFDEKRNDEMLVGYCNRDGFSMINSKFDSIFRAEYNLYQPDPVIVAQIKDQLKKKRIVLVMGTWCGDSRDWVPRFYKVMDQARFDYKKLSLICVDHQKKADVEGLDKLKIERVPTFIFYKKRKETGRIIEVPSDLIEKDILKHLGAHK